MVEKRIELTNGGFAIVDEEDYAVLSRWSWRKDQYGYATRVQHVEKIDGKWRRKTIFMHRQIFGDVPKDIDHINRDRLDNRRSNLRSATRSENNANAKIRKDNTSGHKGVYWHSDRNKWTAEIAMNKKRTYLGIFVDIEDAVAARKAAEIKLFGEFRNV